MLGQPLLGQILGGRYRVAQNLSAGGFGHTYIVEDMQRPGAPRCVLKHLSFSSQNPELLQQARRMFQNEAEALESLGQHDRIPRLLAYFEEAGEFYLVQELIEGRSLSDELKLGAKLPVAEVVAILDDVLELLQFVHGQGVIHRDLKPENLIRRQSDGKLVLIDFGAVKTMDVLSMPDRGHQASVPVYTTGYAASEQCLGQPRFASDLYALGMIAIQALTGIHPTQLDTELDSGNPIWQAEIDDRLQAVLHKMTAFHFNQRYQTAIEVQHAIRGSAKSAGTSLIPAEGVEPDAQSANPAKTRIQTLPPKQLSSIVLIGIGTIVAALFATKRLNLPAINNADNLISPTPLQISNGERILNVSMLNPHKQAAAEHMAHQRFEQAMAALKLSRVVDLADPEVLIQLHNAEIGSGKSYTIAVVVPLKDKPNFANEVLRGVAQAQHQINASGGVAGVPIKIMIADDNNQSEMAEKIARSLADNPAVLGVVGHGTSKTTYAAAQIYKPAELVVVSPLSSAENLADFKQYLFRTIPSDRRSAKQLADYAMNRLKKDKIAVFYNSQDPYSQSLKATFKDALDYGYGKKIVDSIDINQPDFDAGERLNALKAKKVDAIFLATNHDRFKDAMTIVQANDNQLPILAGETFYAQQTLNVGKKDILGMVLAVPAQQVNLNRSSFQNQAKQLWGKPVTWRSALGYDAAQTIFAGLKQAQTRPGIRLTLANPKFQTAGATQAVQFEETGDRLGAVQLLQVLPDSRTKVPSFQPIRP